ncbi:hypothetical protein J7890_03705 [Mycoplasmopsis agalactiae]|uniref:hypothetical protein n=1 Tax=Mycoplasmopsis agalactiae TaxID=2110 RepID=UPI001F33D41E|nr:hypothetical protein [Mycoplasmopsis agalactiae]MCE6079208.1 hypothetical protein [Mycoplasmopsis agalactiae]
MSDSDCAENSYLPETSFEPSLAAITSFLSLNSTVDRSSAFMSFKPSTVFRMTRTSSS